MSDQLNKVIDQLLGKTVELRDQIFSYEADSEDEEEVEKWAILLAERQELMDNIDLLIQQGQLLTKEQKESSLTQVILIDEEVKPLLQKHMVALQTKITEIQRKKSVSQQYTGYAAPEAYGAFFDKRK